jgi:tRNA modification GTPase
MYNDDNIVALATPPGIGALAIIRISGKELLELAHLLTNKKHIEARFANFTGIYHPINSSKLDSGVLIYYKSPKSFTGEDLIEINCHGGEYIANSIINALFEYGVRMAHPGEFSYRAFMNGKIDLIQAESITQLINSKSSAAVQNNLNNVNGFVSNHVDKLKNDVKNILSIIEHEMDFNEGEIEFSSKNNLRNDINNITNQISSMLDTAHYGKVLNSGIRIVLFGPPNAGKSSLFNAILGYERALVADVSGTTRDVVEAWIEIGGVSVCLIDTAGYWVSNDPLESMGIDKTREQLNVADFVLFVDSENPKESFKKLKIDIDESKLVFIKSKSDLHTGALQSSDLNVSSKLSSGIQRVMTLLSTKVSTVVSHTTSNPTLSSKRQRVLLNDAHNLCSQIVSFTNEDFDTDILASMLHGLNDILSDIIGKTTNEDVLNNIFSEFCVGK